MSGEPLVVDACVLLTAWLPGERHQKAADVLLLDIREGKIRPQAPHLLTSELLNGLYRCVKGKAGQPPRITTDQVQRIWNDCEQLKITLHDTRALTARIMEVAVTYDRPTIYDATYLALAEFLKAQFVTADARLLHALGEKLPWVVSLEKYGA